MATTEPRKRVDLPGVSPAAITKHHTHTVDYTEELASTVLKHKVSWGEPSCNLQGRILWCGL